MIFALRLMVVLKSKTNQISRMIIFKLAVLVVGYYLGQKLDTDLSRLSLGQH